MNYNADYKKVADYIEDIFKIYKKNPKLVLDLACGTGSLTIELDKRGYDMIGLDLSPEMLSAANSANIENIENMAGMKNNNKENKTNNILWTNQDMCDFELYGTVDAVICCFDSLNYILENKKIEKCFESVYNYLNPGGLFIFDVNTKYKFEHIYANNDIVLENETEDVFCFWRNCCNKYYKDNKKEITCDFYLTLFVMSNETGYYRYYKRYDEKLKEKYYSPDYLKYILEKINFENINIYYDFSADKNNIKNKEKKKNRICFAALKK